jgi:hypothetical protein
MIGFIGASITISLIHNLLKQLTINNCLRLAPFCYTVAVFSTTVTGLVLFHESLTSGLRMNYECQMTTHLLMNYESLLMYDWTAWVFSRAPHL